MRNLLKAMMKWTFNFSASCDMWGPQIVLFHIFGLTNIIQFYYKARRSRPFPAPNFICWFFRVLLFDRPAMLAKVPQLSRQVASWGICLVDKLVWIIFEWFSFLRGIPKGFLAICNIASEIYGPRANTGLISSAFFIGLRGAHATWDAMPLELVEPGLEPLKIRIAYNSLICPF